MNLAQEKKQKIDFLTNEKTALLDSVASDFAKYNKNIISDTLAASPCVILELLQNANDYPAPGAGPIHIRCSITPEYLIFQHNGKVFDSADAEKLNKFFATNEDSDKRQNINLSGYKGIGFKALYNETNYVLICSGGFLYRYDQEYWLKTENGRFKNYPWQNMPIWTTQAEMPQNLPVTLTDNVNFVFRISSNKSTLLIEKIFSHPNWLVFLENIGCINVTNFADHYEKNAIITSNLNQLCRLAKVDIETAYPQKSKLLTTYEWAILTFSEDIPYDLRCQVNSDPSDVTIADKFKNSEKINISFALAIKKEKVISHPDSTLFCNRMPLVLTLNLPVLLNADFLSDMSRAKLILSKSSVKGAWNFFVLKTAMQHYCRLLTVIASSDFFDKKTILNALSIPDFRQIGDEKSIIEEFFNATLNVTRFLPALFDNRTLLTISEAKYDQTELIPQLLKEKAKERSFITSDEYLNFSAGKFAISYLENISVLKKFNEILKGKFELIDLGNIVEKISYLAMLYKSNIAFHIHLHKTLHNYFNSISSSTAISAGNPRKQLIHELQKSTFLIRHTAKLDTASLAKSTDLFLSAQTAFLLRKDHLDELTCALGLQFLHPDLLEHKELTSWFKNDLAISEINELSLLETRLIPLVEKNTSTLQDATFSVVAFIFYLFLKNKIPDHCKEVLKSMVVKTKAGSFKKASELFLADEYNPKEKLETLLNEPSFCLSFEYSLEIRNKILGRYSDDYYESQIKFFFLSLGVVEKISLVIRNKYLVETAKNNKELYINDYIKNVKDNNICNTPQNRVFEKFISISFINFLQAKQSYVPLFWAAVKAHWSEVNKKLKLMAPVNKGIQNEHISYLIFILKSQKVHFAKQSSPPYISNDKNYYSYELYWSGLYDICSLAPSIPVAAFLEEYTQEMAAELGFKIRIEIKDVIAILNALNTCKSEFSVILKNFKSLFNKLLSQQLTDEERGELIKWKDGGGLLPCESNQLRLAKELKIFAIPNEFAPSDSLTYLKEPLTSSGSRDEMKKIGFLFDLSIDSERQYQLQGATRDDNLEQKLKAHLPGFALIIAHTMGKQAENVLQDIWGKFQKLTCYTIEKLEEGKEFLVIDQKFYRTNRARLKGPLQEELFNQLIAVLELEEDIVIQKKLKTIFVPGKSSSEIELAFQKEYASNSKNKFVTDHLKIKSYLLDLSEINLRDQSPSDMDLDEEVATVLQSKSNSLDSNSTEIFSDAEDDDLLQNENRNNDSWQTQNSNWQAEQSTIEDKQEQHDDVQNSPSFSLASPFSTLRISSPAKKSPRPWIIATSAMPKDTSLTTRNSPLSSFPIEEFSQQKKNTTTPPFSEDDLFSEDEEDAQESDMGELTQSHLELEQTGHSSAVTQPTVAAEITQPFPRAGKSPSNSHYMQLKRQQDKSELSTSVRSSHHIPPRFPASNKSPRNPHYQRPPSSSAMPHTPYRPPHQHTSSSTPTTSSQRRAHVESTNLSRSGSASPTDNRSRLNLLRPIANTSYANITERLMNSSSSQSSNLSSSNFFPNGYLKSSPNSSLSTANTLPTFSPNVNQNAHAHLSFSQPKKHVTTSPFDMRTTIAENSRKKIIELLNDNGMRKGQLGEKYVYDLLRKQYLTSANSSCKLIGTKQGFLLRDALGQNLVEIIWFNAEREQEQINEVIDENSICLFKITESGKPADFKIIFHNETLANGKNRKCYIEVKATQASAPNIANFTRREWNRMFKYGYQQAYSIYRVYDVESAYPTHQIFENPAQEIRTLFLGTGQQGTAFYVEGIQIKI